MALRRRGQSQQVMGIWPGFVDAMTAMLLVLTFVLSIFMITQYFLRDTILGQEEQLIDRDEALSSLTSKLNALSDVLALETSGREAAEENAKRLQASLTQTDQALADTVTERDLEREAAQRAAAERAAFEALTVSLREDLNKTSAETVVLRNDLAVNLQALSKAEQQKALEAAAAEALRKRLANSTAELTAMEMALEQRRAEAEETLTLLAAAQLAQREVEKQLEQRDTALTLREALLSTARSELAKVSESSLEEQKQLALLNEQTRALREQLDALNRQLSASEAERATLEATTDQQGAELENLGNRLNVALAARNEALEEVKRVLEEQVDELEDFRSEFFGRIKAAVADRDDVEIVGDRFVFQSEVLFAPGSADLNDAGKAELSKFAQILNEISSDIPADLNWILRIDGHTDRRPLARGRTPYRNNWELSQARALSVAEYLIQSEDVAPDRLAPTGFGEFQPLTDGRTADAYARNRRIELKLTER